MLRLSVLAAALAALLSACGGVSSPAGGPVETLAPRAWTETLEADGEIQAAANTPLAVPGSGWSSRVLVDMVPDGSAVTKGQVVARFDAPQARADLSQADLELLRKALAEEANRQNAAVEKGVLAGDRAKVEDDLGLSRRYAGVDLSVFARNTILDALADVGFLTKKRTYLDWKGSQVQARAAAQDAVLHSQRDSVAQNAAQQRRSLDALELVAPHDGVFLLAARWDGAKAQVGANQMAGEPFGTLPDLDKLVAHFSIAEGQAYGLKPGLPVRVRLAGTGTALDLTVTRVGSSANQMAGEPFGALPDLDKLVAHFSVAEGQAYGLKPGLPVRVRLAGTGLALDLTVTRVGSSASVISPESPVKYSDFDAAIGTDTARKLGLKPGQALHGTVHLVTTAAALTVPNIALVQDGAGYAVYTVDAGRTVKHKVELGRRGPVRSEISSGLASGAQIVLLPSKAEKT